MDPGAWHASEGGAVSTNHSRAESSGLTSHNRAGSSELASHSRAGGSELRPVATGRLGATAAVHTAAAPVPECKGRGVSARF